MTSSKPVPVITSFSLVPKMHRPPIESCGVKLAALKTVTPIMVMSTTSRSPQTSATRAGTSMAIAPHISSRALAANNVADMMNTDDRVLLACGATQVRLCTRTVHAQTKRGEKKSKIQDRFLLLAHVRSSSFGRSDMDSTMMTTTTTRARTYRTKQARKKIATRQLL